MELPQLRGRRRAPGVPDPGQAGRALSRRGPRPWRRRSAAGVLLGLLLLGAPHPLPPKASQEDLDDLVSSLPCVKGRPKALRSDSPSCQLLVASASGDEETVDRLLEEGTRPDHSQETEETALQLAIRSEHPGIVLRLLEAGADPNRSGPRKLNPLGSAWDAGSLSLARALLEAGADARQAHARVAPVSDLAYCEGNRPWIELLASRDVRPLPEEATRLLSRIARGSCGEDRLPERVEELLELGADPDAERGALLLHWAVLRSSPDLLDLLLLHEADLERVDPSFGETALYLAAKTGRIELLDRLLQESPNVEAEAKDGSVPLHAALYQGHYDVARSLLAAGADAGAASHDGRTGLMILAVRSPTGSRGAEGKALMMQDLVAAGAPLDAVDATGASALDLAADNCNRQALEVLAHSGARPGPQFWETLERKGCAVDPTGLGFGHDALAQRPLPVTGGPEADPSLPKTDAEAQRVTVEQMCRMGMALMSWLTDAMSGAAAGQRTVGQAGMVGWLVDDPEEEVKWKPPLAEPWDPVRRPLSLSPSQLSELLTPVYLTTVPEVDGWGFRYEYQVAVQLEGENLMVIRSSGSDGVFEEASDPAKAPEKGPFPAAEFHHDLLWADGFFVRWPDSLPSTEICRPPGREGDLERRRIDTGPMQQWTRDESPLLP